MSGYNTFQYNTSVYNGWVGRYLVVKVITAHHRLVKSLTTLYRSVKVLTTGG